MTDIIRNFEAGTVAKCNRCNKANPLPKRCAGQVESTHNGVTVYRLITMATLDCGHMDSHWVAVNDSQAQP